MGEFWEKITGSIGASGLEPPKWFRRDNLLILVLLGVLLFIIALPVKKEDSAATDTGTEITEQYNAGILTSSGQQNVAQQDTVYVGTQAVTAGSMEEYAAYLEGKLKKMLESVQGVGEVEVMITLESSEERIVEKDMTAERSQTEEQDSAGGTRTVSSSNTGYQTVYQEGSQGSPFVVKTITPKVEGVLVVAEGAGKGNMTGEITQVVQALFGVEAHKVKVLEK
ncbi:MAG: stage III sporulation protein AG [Lachnospiraceae bacterium]|uniref:stage III sporulation protein AG n=1 Tax=Simiaoa sp. TaxID=2944202 RepID=UPI001EBFBBD4|nr:stage III sporulation protein AG [Lachnospiraceae bacterium]